MNRIILIALLSFLLISFVSKAQTPVLKWKSTFDGKSYVEDRGVAIRFDSQGNTVACGYEENGCTQIDICVTKYGPFGDTLWHASYDGFNTYGQDDFPLDMEVDGAGNIYITGKTEINNFDYAVTLKYNAAGTLLWSNKYSTAESTGNRLALDGQGNVIMCGFRKLSSNKDYLVVKYNATGAEQWARFYSNGNHDEAMDVECDASGNIYVTGRRSGVNAFYDWATVKYDNNGTQLWADVYANATSFAYSEEPVDLEIDASGDIVVAGAAPFLSASNRDYYVIKYNPSGSRLWEAPFANANPNSDEYPVDMALDSLGNVYLIGNSVGNGTGQDVVTVKFNASGQFQWQARLDSISQTDYARSIVYDNLNNSIIVAGDLTVSISGFLKRDWVVARYDLNGALLNKRILDGPASDFDLPADMVVDANGILGLTGMYSIHAGGYLNGDQVTVKIDGSLATDWLRYSNGNSFTDDQVADLYVDAAGNSYVTGFTKGGDNTLEDLAVVKFDSQGAKKWSYVYQGLVEKSSDKGIAITVDANQVVYVTGTVDTSGGTSYRDIYTAALDSNGNLLWDKIYAGNAGGADYPVAISLNGQGGVYVAGTTINPATGLDATIVSYDNNGNQQWATSFDGGGQADVFNCMTVDGSGNAYAAGLFVPSNGALSDGLLVKFDPAGTISWDTTYDFSSSSTSDRDFFNSITMDLTGNVVVAGQSNTNFVTIQYDANGNPNWIQNYSHSANPDSATVVMVDSSNNILVGGTFGQFIEADFGIVKYRNDGTLIWDRRYANTAGSDDILKDMAIDSIGNVYVTGWETANFSTNYNFMTVSYDSSGVFRYELIWSEPVGVGPDYGKKISLDANGNIYIAGDATDNCDGNAFVNGFRWDFQVNKYGPNSSVGFNEPTESSPTLIIMPNPSNGLARVQWENETQSKAVIRVVDAAGRRIHESETNDEFLLLNTGYWSKGTYIVSVFKDDVIHHDRLVVY
ncbi:MAG: T9SS type A sorting domain-containing protein [Bacteroidota bacterium]